MATKFDHWWVLVGVWFFVVVDEVATFPPLAIINRSYDFIILLVLAAKYCRDESGRGCENPLFGQIVFRTLIIAV